MNSSKTLDKMFRYYEKMFTKPIKINNVDSTGFFYEIQSSQTNWKPDTKHLFIKHNSVKRGDLITALNEHWLVVDDVVTYNSVYDKAIVQRCNNITNINFTGTVISFPSIIVARTFDITEGNNANFVDGNMNITIQDTANARCIYIDQRIIFKNMAYLVSGIDSSVIGLITLNCRLTEKSNLYDDYENSIADRYRYENTYSIEVINGNSFNIGVNQETQLNIRIWATRVIGGNRFQVSNPILSFVSSDERILTVDSLGNVISLAEGCAIISVILKSNDTIENFEIVAQTDLLVTVKNAVVIENFVTITGNDVIYFEKTVKYIAKLFENGIEVADTFTFRLTDINGNVVPTKTAKLLNVTSTSCEVQTGEINTIVTLIAKSISTEIEGNKNITIRDIL